MVKHTCWRPSGSHPRPLSLSVNVTVTLLRLMLIGPGFAAAAFSAETEPVPGTREALPAASEVAQTPASVAPPPAGPATSFSLIGLDQLDSDGVALATRGLVARIGERQIVADAARYDLQRGDLFATGQVVYRQPGVRISAARLGLHLPPGHREATDFRGVRGDAWDIEALITTAERTIRIRADRVAMADEALTFYGVELDFGHGGIIGFNAPKAVVTLRQPKPGEDPAEARSHVEGIALVSPTGTLVHLPVLWLPYLYRDFSLNYPWTRVRGGYSRRQGTYGRFWIGSDLPEIAGWHPGVDARIDDNSRAGWGFGLRPYWSHERFGRGDAEWFVMPRERVRGNDPSASGTEGADSEGTELQSRRAEAFDAGHYANLGSGAVAGRFTSIPDGDVPGTPPDYRFLQDYLPTRLEHDPLPRQGATLAYGLPGVTATVDTERRINPTQLTTERWFGVQAQIHPLRVVGPLHVAGDTWVEDLHQVHVGTCATRLTSRVYATAGEWFPGGIGSDATAGVKETRYASGEIAGVAQDDAARRAFFTDAGIKLRLSADLDGMSHTLVPRIGVQLIGPGAGEELPVYGFGDGRESFEEDARYWVAGFDTNLVADRTLFHATIVSRWAMREKERMYVDDTGTSQLSPQRLADISGTVDGSPWQPLRLNASFTYDARPRQWTIFNTAAAWRVAQFMSLTESSTLIPESRSWSHTPGVALFANRYRVDGAVTLRPEGAAVDSWLIEVTRRMVDGDLFLGYEFVRDETGEISDRRISIGFTLAAGGSDLGDSTPSAKTSLSR